MPFLSLSGWAGRDEDVPRGRRVGTGCACYSSEAQKEVAKVWQGQMEQLEQEEWG